MQLTAEVWIWRHFQPMSVQLSKKNKRNQCTRLGFVLRTSAENFHSADEITAKWINWIVRLTKRPISDRLTLSLVSRDKLRNGDVRWPRKVGTLWDAAIHSRTLHKRHAVDAVTWSERSLLIGSASRLGHASPGKFPPKNEFKRNKIKKTLK